MSNFWIDNPKSELDILADGTSKEKIVTDRLRNMIEYIEKDCGDDRVKLAAYKAVVEIDYDKSADNLVFDLITILIAFAALIVSLFNIQNVDRIPVFLLSLIVILVGIAVIYLMIMYKWGHMKPRKEAILKKRAIDECIRRYEMRHKTN